MSFLALSPVSAAVYAALNVAALTALAPGGVHDDVPQAPTFPFVAFDVQERENRGLGRGSLLEVQWRVRAYAATAGMKDAQAIIAKVIELLKDQTLSVSGYAQCGNVFYDETVPGGDELINGIKCHSLVAAGRIYVEA